MQWNINNMMVYFQCRSLINLLCCWQAQRLDGGGGGGEGEEGDSPTPVGGEEKAKGSEADTEGDRQTQVSFLFYNLQR